MKPTILVVDDDERSLSVLDRVLSIAGYEVLTTVCGTEVECLLETQSPDIVLLDIRMPGIDGLTILGRVKGDRPNLPIVMMSAYVTMTSLDEAIRSGADGFLEKPFDIDDLRSCLAEALDPVAVTGLPGVRSTAEALATLLFEDGWTVLLVQV
jgi:DNA-binding NtrC family response regulator